MRPGHQFHFSTTHETLCPVAFGDVHRWSLQEQDDSRDVPSGKPPGWGTYFFTMRVEPLL
jgi:hypothetical protein